MRRGLGRSIKAHAPSLVVSLLLALTLGLAPFHPEPHIVKQVRSLSEGRLTALIDVLDLIIHGVPFLVLVLVAARIFRDARGFDDPTSTSPVTR